MNTKGLEQLEMEDDYNAELKNSGFDQQSATNVKNHIALVKSIIESTNQQLGEYNKDIENLRQELSAMKQEVTVYNEEINNTTKPTLAALLKNLKLAIGAQKDENSKLQSQLTELKKEKSQIQQLIISCINKLAVLENQVGSYS